MYPESDDLSEYLVSDPIIDWQNPAVMQKALELTSSLSDEVAKARCLYEWVRDSIPHSNDADLEVLPCTASEVLHHGTGICFSKSHLLAALLRAVNIPAGFCYQVLRLDPPVDNEPVLHGFNAIYLATLDKWIRVDARGNTNGINAQFSTNKEQLAFAMDPLADEFIYEAIFAAPVDCVVNRLKMYKPEANYGLIYHSLCNCPGDTIPAIPAKALFHRILNRKKSRSSLERLFCQHHATAVSITVANQAHPPARPILSAAPHC